MRFRFLCLLIMLFGALQASAQTTYRYMHIFYYGPQDMGPTLQFSPDFQGQKEISTDKDKLAKAEDIVIPRTITAVAESYDYASDGTVILNGKKLTPEQTKAWEQQKRDKDKAERSEFERRISERADSKRALLTTWLNKAAADGWEVVQMVSNGNGNLVYLLRKP